jgi:hypothetical protein
MNKDKARRKSGIIITDTMGGMIYIYIHSYPLYPVLGSFLIDIYVLFTTAINYILLLVDAFHIIIFHV